MHVDNAKENAFLKQHIRSGKGMYECGQLSKSVFFKLFDVKVTPILMYGSEILNIDNFLELERAQYYACKRFMCAKRNASNCAVLGDCGRFPMYIESTRRAIKYWLKILKMSQTRFVRRCYDMMLNDDINGHKNWVTSVKVCLQRNGFGYVWQNQTVISEHIFL